MNVRKFIAATARDALRKVKEMLGPDAIILSNRAIPGGVEIMAVAASDMETILPTPVREASVRDDDGADHRIRGNGTAAFLGKSQRHLHKVCILILHLCVPPISKIKSPEHFCFRARQRKAS